MSERKTVIHVMEETTKAHGARIAMRTKADGIWTTTTWAEYHRQVIAAAKAMIHLGLQPGQGVSILGYNCPQWYVADIGAIYAGGLPAGIYTTSSEEQCHYIVEHSDSAIVVVEDQLQLDKIRAVWNELPKLKAVVLMFGDSDVTNVYSWTDFLALGDKIGDDELTKRMRDQTPDDPCTLIYTSGTTGNPKAVMISHDNITWTAASLLDTMNKVLRTEIDAQDLPADVRAGIEAFDLSLGFPHIGISYLPLSHIAEQLTTLHLSMASGGTIAFAESLDALGDNLRDIRPTLFLGVPRVWEKIQEKIVAAAAGNSGLKKKISAWARKKGLEGGYADQRGEPLPSFFSLADKIVFSKVRARLGLDRCLVRATSAAPISKDTLEFFLSLGIPIYEVYGMSECTGPATLSMPRNYQTGSCGPAFPGAELKIAEDGEVCMRGRHVFKGYLKNEHATSETIDDEGWLHSGDLGNIDEQGHLTITGRKKDLLITAGGENIAPQLIEGHLLGIPAVSQAVVIGDRRKYLTALLTLNPDRIATIAAQAGSAATTSSEAAKCASVHAFVMEQVSTVNQRLARVQTIKKVTILPQEFSIEGGEMTPTMKIKRNIVNEKYADQIETMYT